jgi:hypothetical protein
MLLHGDPHRPVTERMQRRPRRSPSAIASCGRRVPRSVAALPAGNKRSSDHVSPVPHSWSPSAGSSDAWRARPRICWRRARACRALPSGSSSTTANSSCAGRLAFSRTIATWSGSSGSRRMPPFAASSVFSSVAGCVVAGLRGARDDHGSGFVGSGASRVLRRRQHALSQPLVLEIARLFARIGGAPASMTISSAGWSCITSPGVSEGRAVSERETIRWPSHGDSRCPA